MKKIILALTLILIFTCLFVVGVNANDTVAGTYYLVQDDTSDLAMSLKDEGKSVLGVSSLYGETGFFATLKAEDNIVIKLAENISYNPGGTINNEPAKSNALRISVSATVTVEFSGYYWWFTSTTDGYTGFVLNNKDATLNLIGTKAKNADGTFKNLGITPNYRTDTAESDRDIDVYVNYVLIYLGKGHVYLENIAGVSKEEFLYHKNTMAGDFSIEYKDCSIGAWFNSYGALHINHTTSYGSIKVDGGIYDYLSLRTLKNDSSIKNAHILQSESIWLDGYSPTNANTLTMENVVLDGSFKIDGDSTIVKATNCDFGAITLIGDSSGGPTLEFNDCTFDSISTGSKTSTILTSYQSPTCEKSGTKTVYTVANPNGLVDEQYAIDNPKTGHIIENPTGVHYDNYFEMGKCTGACKYCGTETAETNPSLPAFITSKGFSTFNDNGVYSVTQGFTINKDVAAYFGEDFDYGILATVNAGATEIAPKLEDQNVVFASLCGSGFVATSIKLTNITNLEQKVVYCMYVKLGDNLVYLNNGTTSDTTAGLSYNDVESILSK